VKRPSKSGSSSLLEYVVVVAVALGLALFVQALLIKPYRIPSGSMEPTLSIGERVIVDRIGNRFSTPGVGDIVVFHPPHGADVNACGKAGEGPFYDGPASHRPCDQPTPKRSGQNFIKRVVGLPGDRIAVHDGYVVRNGVQQREPYIRPCGNGPDCNLQAITVPKGEYFMMGDNRGESDDSRYWGPVPRGWIIGGAFMSYWPPKDMGLL
jgi:signal peptidase I